jgi:hypothetical protein
MEVYLITASDSHLQQRTLSCTCEKRRWLINYEILFNEAPGLNNCIIFLVTFYPLFPLMWLLSSTWSNSVFVLPKIDHGGIMTAGTKDKKSPKI